MGGNKMKIGEFARLSSATIRTLRYYDELDLLKPDNIDKFTGYRFYSPAKLEKMKQIRTMKGIGFTLLEIKSFLAIDDADETAKIGFVAAKKREIALESETRINALDEFIGKLKEEGKNMDKKKRGSCGVFDDEDINKWWKTIKEESDASYGEGAAKLFKIYAGTMVFGAVDENGKAYMWGNNKHGQCDIPENLPPVAELGIGAYHTVALDRNGGLHGWGSNQQGVIDFIDNFDELPEMVSVKAEAYKTAALSRDGRVFSWGNANSGAQNDVPRDMGFVTQIAAASCYTAALNSDGKIFSWGVFLVNQPSGIPDGISIMMIASTENDIACLGSDGKVYGDMRHNELNKKFKPKPELSGIKKIYAGKRNFAALDTEGRIYVWGEYDETEGGCAVVNIPFNLPPVIDAAFEFYGISCLGSDGKVYAWGNFGSMVPPAFDGFGEGNDPIFESALAVNTDAPVNVYTFEKFCEAVQSRVKNITIKGDFTIPESVPVKGPGGTTSYDPNIMNINNDITVIIGEGVTLTVNSTNFIVMKKLINNGFINGRKSMFGVGLGGRLIVYDEIGGTGSVAEGFAVTFNDAKNAAEIRKYLAENTIYTEATYINEEEPVLIIDSDLTIPKAKKLRVLGNQTLKVSAGATLTIEGQIETFRKPIIEGAVIGKIRVIYSAENPYEVYTFEEFREAVAEEILENGIRRSGAGYIKIKNDIVVSGEDLAPFEANAVIVIDEGVTFTIDSDLRINGALINNGAICGSGKLTLINPIAGTGSVNLSGGLKIGIIDAGASELGAYLAAESIYTSVLYINPDIPNRFGGKSIFNINPAAEKTVIAIAGDLVIPAGKSLWLNINCVLRVNEGATLTIEGALTTFNEPEIKGEVIGSVTIIDTGTPREVYTFEEFSKALRERANEITVKADITLTGAVGDPMHCKRLIIGENATLNVGHFLYIKEKLINNGIICGTAKGRLSVSSAIEGTGKVNTAGGLVVGISGGKVSVLEQRAP